MYGAAVRLDADDALLLGTVSNCTRTGEDFVLDITIEQVIPSVSNLARLVATIMQSSPRTPVTSPEALPSHAQSVAAR